MPDEPLPLFRVLVEEYNHQYPEPEPQYPDLARGLAAYNAMAEDDDQGRQKLNAYLLADFYAWLHKYGKSRSALCFSGGGIRSATFGLGVLQGLARRGLLEHFDFMSTVSGGGFLGSWLSAWIHRKGLQKVQEKLKNEFPTSPLEPEAEPIAHLRSFSNYMTPKLGLLSADTWALVAIFIRNLLLNWLVLFPPILLVLMIPRFSIVAIRTGSRASIPAWLAPGTGDGAFWIAVVLGLISIAYVYVSRPSLADGRLRGEYKAGSVFPNALKRQDSFLTFCLAPLLGAAVLITTYYAWLAKGLGEVSFPRVDSAIANLGLSLSALKEPWFVFLCFGVMLTLGALLISFGWRRDFKPARIFWEFAFAVFSGGLGGLFTWLIAGKLFDYPAENVDTVVAYVCFAAPAFLGAFLLAATAFVGISSRVTTDADREWVARAGAWIMIASAAWSLVSSIVVYGPILLMSGFKTAVGSVSVGALSGLVTLILGRSSKTSAKDKQSSGITDIVLMVAAPLFAAFILICLSLATSLLIVGIGNLSPAADMKDYRGFLAILNESPVGLLLQITVFLLFVGVTAGVCININKFSLHGAYRDRLIRAYLGASRAEEERKPNPFTGFDEDDNLQMQQLRNQLFHDDNVTVTKLVPILKDPATSAHPTLSMYLRERLSETTKKLVDANTDAEVMKYALLDDLNRILLRGSIYEEARFQGIDLNVATIRDLINQDPLVETLRLNRLLLQRAYPEIFYPGSTSRPLHVINITLNLVGGKNLAWQDRKAASFTVSPLHSGSYSVGYRNSNAYGRASNNRAISLGTAATISGAAVSPNMGYYSSTFVTFLLTLFNLRLGWWLGNPGRAGRSKYGRSTYDKSGPNFAARPLFDETLGLTDATHPYVYLSDGGHFENLALYEMVLRRCKRIFISDGSADPDFGFEGLGNAVSKIRVDLGIPIDIQEIFMLPRDEDENERHYGEINKKFLKKYCAIGTIGYSAIDGGGNSADKKRYDGVLIYVKAFLSGGEPIDIYNYAKTHKTFPHESTADQMFGESQFESYRALGSYMVDRICENIPRDAGLQDLFGDRQ